MGINSILRLFQQILLIKVTEKSLIDMIFDMKIYMWMLRTFYMSFSTFFSKQHLQMSGMISLNGVNLRLRTFCERVMWACCLNLKVLLFGSINGTRLPLETSSANFTNDNHFRNQNLYMVLRKRRVCVQILNGPKRERHVLGRVLQIMLPTV